MKQAIGIITEKAVKEHLEDLKSGKINKKQLARKLLKEYPDIYKDIEHARTSVRSYTGAGNIRAIPVENFKSTIKHGLKALPQSLAKQFPPFIFPAFNKPLIISDLHFPYHHTEAILTALNFAKKIKCDAVLINGDGIDFYQLSKFVRDPINRSVADELEMLSAFLDYLKEELKVPIFYKVGNHEERYETYLKTKAKELIGVPDFELKSILKLEKRGIEYIASRQKIKMGKLTVLHGHEFGRSIFNPVNPARGVFLKTKANTLIGHYHQKSEHDESTINNDAIGCYSTGCLCDLSPEYAPFAYTKWNHGFAVVHMDGDIFSVDNRRIINGKVL